MAIESRRPQARTPVMPSSPSLHCELLDICEIPTARILESTYALWTHCSAGCHAS
jgi:hypothetical protein